MIEQDTIRLLRECDAGIKMGVSSIDDVLESTKNKNMHSLLSRCKAEHEKLKEELQAALDRFHDEGKNPNIMAKTMSAAKTNMEMMIRQHHCRPDDRRMQHGRQVACEIPQSVQGR